MGTSSMRQEAVDRRHHLGALADRSADPFDRARPHVADREHAGRGRFERRRARPPLAGPTPVVTKPALSSGHADPAAIRSPDRRRRKERRCGSQRSVSRPSRWSRHRTRSRLPLAAPARATISVCVISSIFGVARDAIDQVARHAIGKARPSDHHAHLGRVAGQKHRALAGRVAAADQNDLFAGAQPRLDLRGPVPDSAALEPGYVGDRRMAIASAAGDDDRPSLNALAVRLEDEDAVRARAIERLDGTGIMTSAPNFCA